MSAVFITYSSMISLRLSIPPSEKAVTLPCLTPGNMSTEDSCGQSSSSPSVVAEPPRRRMLDGDSPEFLR
jgi:hypothetical protein